jgi:DNA-binding MarR family transcriptional regulator
MLRHIVSHGRVHAKEYKSTSLWIRRKILVKGHTVTMPHDTDTESDLGTAVAANRTLDAWLSIARPVEATTARIESALSDRHAICLSAYEIMKHLAGKRGWTPLSEVCKEIARSQPRISRLVTQMQKEGLVDRTRVDGDGRAFQLHLTRKGRRVYFAASETLVETFDQAARENPLFDQLLAVRTGWPEAPADPDRKGVVYPGAMSTNRL